MVILYNQDKNELVVTEKQRSLHKFDAMTN
jgi:hypothetical protein